MKAKKQKKWWQHLLMIPLQLLIDAVGLVIALLIDDRFFAALDEGHGFPAVTLVTAFVLLAITAIVTTKTILSVLKALSVRKRAEAPVEPALYEAEPEPPAPGWHYLVPVVIQIVISVVVVFVSGSIEINRFYADPNHIGFAIPIVTLLLAGLMFLLTLLVIAVCIVLAAIRRKARRKNAE